MQNETIASKSDCKEIATSILSIAALWLTSGLVLFGQVGCGPQNEPAPHHPAHLQRELEMSARERAETLPNDLFVAVLNENVPRIQQLITQSPGLLRQENVALRDRPLGFALRRGLRSVTLLLLRHMPQEDHAYQNQNGESYAFLAARSGDLPVLQELATQLMAATRFKPSYLFAQVDPPDNQGRPAHFVARDSTVLRFLHQEYQKNYVPIWGGWWFFTYEDNQGRSFLHWAAHENRTEVVSWAVQRFCHARTVRDPSWWSVSSWWTWFRRQTDQLGLYANFVVGDISLLSNTYVNRTDNEGLTPLMLAARHRSLQSMDALVACPWVNTELRDHQRNTTLHHFVRGLDPREARQPDFVMRSLRRLVETETCGLRRCFGRNSLLRAANADGETAAHLAARLNDPQVLDYLQGMFPVQERNDSGQTPADIRVNTQQRRRQAPNAP